MGLSFRRRSGRIADGSKLIVPGQITTGVKVFPNTFQYKQGSKDKSLGPGIEVDLVPTNTPTPSPSPTPTPTPQPEVLIDPIITQNGEYIYVGDGYYLKY
jgi:hypothetical protein